MAWVSVHDTVDGSKLRELAKSIGCTKEEALGSLVSLWIWGLKNADKFGEVVGADRADILDAFSTKFINKVPGIVDILIENHWINETDGKLVIHDWDQWQALWYKAVERKKGDVERKAKERKEKKEKAEKKNPPTPKDDGSETGEVDAPENLSMFPPEDENSSEQETAKPKYSSDFDEFWKAYPRKIDKGNAYKKYMARRRDGFSPEELLTAAKAYAVECVKLKTEQTFIKHPKTFLSDSLPFTDYIRKEKETTEESVPTSENPFEEWSEQ